MRSLSSFVVSVVLCVSSLFAADPYLVADLRTRHEPSASSSPVFLTAVNGAAIFSAKRKFEGQITLWRTDGTAAGTYELLGGRDLAYQSGFLVIGTTAWFTAYEGEGWKLWRSDGTAQGTTALTPAQTAGFQPIAVIGNRVFAARDQDLWIQDDGGFRRIATLGTGMTRPANVTTWNERVYIGTSTGLWKTDGTESGTVKIAPAASANVTLANNQLFFSTTAADTGAELWITDGTEAGNRLVADGTPGTGSTLPNSSLSAVTPFGNGVFFLGANGELGVSNGTASGTRILRKGPAPTAAQQYATLNGILYFAFNDGEHGVELWRSDGTEAGTRMVRDASEGAGATVFSIRAGATRVYYYYVDAVTKRADIFESDGTEAGTHLAGSTRVASWVRSGSSLVAIGDRVYFPGDDGDLGVEPWTSDGGASGVRIVMNVAVEAPGSSRPQNFVAGASRLYFTAEGDGPSGNRIYSSDGTAAGTVALLETASSYDLPEPHVTLGDTLFFLESSQLIRFDPAGNVVLKKIVRSQKIMKAGDRLYFVARGDDERDQLFVSDGTPEGTKQLTTREVGPAGASVVMLANRPHFFAGASVYATDGTAEGTRQVASMKGFSQQIKGPYVLNGSLFLIASHPNDYRLWKFSGAPGDASVVQSLTTGAVQKNTAAVIGTTLLFGWQQVRGIPAELWKTDGTAAGTVRIKQFPVAETSSVGMSELVPNGNHVIFAMDDPTYGYEPWVSDGTPEGTHILRDINPTGLIYGPGFIAIGGIVYFTAVDAEHGAELWQTDGTTEGTKLVVDLVPGSGSSSPGSLTRVGNLLFFSATTNDLGRELWALPLPGTPEVTIDDARALEASGRVTIPIRLEHASNQRVTVGYETADGSAKSGQHYTAASGTLTFEPGETLKTIHVPITDDTAIGTTRTFAVHLKNANAAIVRTAGFGVIEDDDAFADLQISLRVTNNDAVVLHNAGPAPASNVRFCVGVSPPESILSCIGPFDLAAGESLPSEIQTFSANSIVAKATLWERDPNLADNTRTWSKSVGASGAPGSGFADAYVLPATLRAGETGTLTVRLRGTETVQITVSDPTAITIPAQLPVSENVAATVTFTSLKPGVVTIFVKSSQGTDQVTVHVLAPGETVRTNPFVRLSSSWLQFGSLNALNLQVEGLALNGTTPTGTVTFYEDGKPLGTAPIVNRFATLRFVHPTPGARLYSALYNGDPNFYPVQLNASGTFQVGKGTPTFHALREDNAVEIILRGASGYPPAGVVAVSEGNIVRAADLALVPRDNDSASVMVNGISAGARTITIFYNGSPLYDMTSATVPIFGRKRRS